MEILHTVAEAVFISFIVGAMVGGAIVAHLQLKPSEQNESEGKMQSIKVKASDHDH